MAIKMGDQVNLFQASVEIDVFGGSPGAKSEELSDQDALECGKYTRPEFDLAKFIVDRATKTAIEAVITCSVDGSKRWELFFDAGLVDAISEDSEFECEFFTKLCGGRGLPYMADILDGYLNRLPLNRRRKLMDGTNIKRKFHPAALCFTGASFPTKSGEYYLQALQVLVKHGLTHERIEYIAGKSFVDIERACSKELDPFIDFLFKHTRKLPEDLAVNIASRSPLAEKIIAYFVLQKKMDLTFFMTQEVKLTAKPSVIDFISALHGRTIRETEHIFVGAEG